MADALERLQHVTDGVPVVMAVNHEYADDDAAARTPATSWR